MTFMRNRNLCFAVVSLCLCVACSPRDFLTRRLAADLIAASHTFRDPQQFWLRIGIVSNKDFISPEYLVLQHSGWINGTSTRCPADVSPPPCWDVALTPLGVDTFRDLMRSTDAEKQYFSVPAARRELVAVTGISRVGPAADVDFSWRWKPLNEVGAALYAGGVQYRSTVAFRHYDDGWRVIESASSKPRQSLDDALKNSDPTP
jgi:hypothetical protein